MGGIDVHWQTGIAIVTTCFQASREQEPSSTHHGICHGCLGREKVRKNLKKNNVQRGDGIEEADSDGIMARQFEVVCAPSTI